MENRQFYVDKIEAYTKSIERSKEELLNTFSDFDIQVIERCIDSLEEEIDFFNSKLQSLAE